MSIKDYLVKKLGISEARFDEVAELACRIKDGGVPICKYLSGSQAFEMLVVYGMANREGRNADES